ncbi:GntR family transcriptional regulator [Nocardioides marmoriginsengisoli]|uniref:GntR family transcriptional regulator n=1 Tax=Nocardioides marmoriginsengisoli TaxID=661483 RepID=A0A3N0CEP7_9ACTN|nr:GntR family transcriptional regulator [Nocardioides marmoriginsengisoli]RNL61922.1 GntR family transcriptional regulator [Nocardioides marmoriginsengisoli]
MTDAGSFQKPLTTVEAVLIELRRALLEGEYPAGARMNVDAISKQLGTSRAPVRDALRILEGEQQVVYAPHRGYIIPEMALEDLFDLYRTRELLEAEAAAITVPQLSDETIAGLRTAVTTIDKALAAGDRITATYANRDFHFALFKSPGHEQLVSSITGTWNADAYRSFYLRDLGAAAELAKDHAGIAEAAAAKDVAAVIDLQNKHRDGELANLLQLLRDKFDVDAHLKAKPWHSRLKYRPRAR